MVWSRPTSAHNWEIRSFSAAKPSVELPNQSNQVFHQVAVGRAVDAYVRGRAWWRADLVPRVMRADHGWGRSGEEYLSLYREAAGA